MSTIYDIRIMNVWYQYQALIKAHGVSQDGKKDLKDRFRELKPDMNMLGATGYARFSIVQHEINDYYAYWGEYQDRRNEALERALMEWNQYYHKYGRIRCSFQTSCFNVSAFLLKAIAQMH